MAQDLYNQHTDFIETNNEGNVIGLWADYYKENITPTDHDIVPEIVNKYSVITYSGTTPIMKVGGSYKKFTVTFYKDDEVTDFEDGEWSFTIDDIDATDLIKVLTPTYSSELNENQIKVKFIGSGSYIGKNIVATYTSTTGIKSSVTMDIAGL